MGMLTRSFSLLSLTEAAKFLKIKVAKKLLKSSLTAIVVLSLIMLMLMEKFTRSFSHLSFTRKLFKSSPTAIDVKITFQTDIQTHISNYRVALLIKNYEQVFYGYESLISFY